jgi:hypothetical protein
LSTAFGYIFNITFGLFPAPSLSAYGYIFNITFGLLSLDLSPGMGEIRCNHFSRDFPKLFITSSQVGGILDSNQALVNGQVPRHMGELFGIGRTTEDKL